MISFNQSFTGAEIVTHFNALQKLVEKVVEELDIPCTLSFDETDEPNKNFTLFHYLTYSLKLGTEHTLYFHFIRTSVEKDTYIIASWPGTTNPAYIKHFGKFLNQYDHTTNTFTPMENPKELTIKEKAELVERLTKEIIEEVQSEEFISKSENNAKISSILNVFGGEHFIPHAKQLNSFIQKSDD